MWLSSMELFKNYFEQIVDDVNEKMALRSVKLQFKDSGTLEFDKYRHLRNEMSAKRTWFFEIVFKRGGLRVRYLFYFGYPSYKLREHTQVVLILAKGIDYIWEYIPLEDITQTNIPDMYQVGYDMKEEKFISLTVGGVEEGKVESIATKFFNQVIERDFGG